MVGGWTDIYQKAKACGFDMTVAQSRDAVEADDVRIVDQLITAPMDDPMLVELAATLHRARPFQSVLSFQEHGVMNAALIRDRLSVFGNPLQPVALTRDKSRMRDHLQEAGIASVPHLTTNCAEEIRAFAKETGWPIIIKPQCGSGSRQVYKVSAEEELAPALADVLAADPSTRLLAEAFVSGPEVSVEAITWEGQHTILAVTDKITTGPPRFVELGHNMPSALPPEHLDAIRQLTLAFLDSIGHRYGPSHTEIIIGGQGPVIVESHTRTGGDRIFEMVEMVTGVDMFLTTLQGFRGQFERPRPETGARGAAIRFFAFGPGIVSSISGIEAARACSGVVRVVSQLEIGMELLPIRNPDHRLGYVLAAGTSAHEAAQAAMSAMNKIRVDLE
jgi:biotin carboxylase